MNKIRPLLKLYFCYQWRH